MESYKELSALLQRIREAFDRIGGLPDRKEDQEDFAERVEAGDAIRILFQVASELQAWRNPNA